MKATVNLNEMYKIMRLIELLEVNCNNEELKEVAASYADEINSFINAFSENHYNESDDEELGLHINDSLNLY